MVTSLSEETVCNSSLKEEDLRNRDFLRRRRPDVPHIRLKPARAARTQKRGTVSQRTVPRRSFFFYSTYSVAALLVNVLPLASVITQRYFCPPRAAVAPTLSVAVVLPVMPLFFHVLLPAAQYCH